MAGLGDILVGQGTLQPDQLQHAQQHAGGGSLAKALIELGYATEPDLVRAFATSLNMPYTDVDAASVDQNAAALLPAADATALTALPVGFGSDNTLVVAVADPNDTTLGAKLTAAIGLPVTLALAPRRALVTAIEQHAANQVPAAVGAAPAVSRAPAPAAAPTNGSAQLAAVPPPISEMQAQAVVETPAPPAVEALLGHNEPRLRSEETTEIDLDDLLRILVERGGSDLHLTAGIPPMIRINGDLTPIEDQPVCKPDELQKLLYSIMTQKNREVFENELELDMSYAIPNVARFRVNVFQQRDAMASVMRVIPFEILPLEELGVPEQVANFAYLPRGFVLVTGPTGSGKSTTLASLIDLVNRNKPSHIMTVEDPIEFLHEHKRSVVNQREVGTDTHGFAAALKHVLRQDPDVILVGELRDLETIQIALTAAETGHLVFGTLHTQDAPQSIDRIIDVFPPHQQEQIRVMLAGALRGVVCQTLLKTSDGKGRTVACEVMVATSGVRNLIREGKTHQIYSAIQAGASHGMVAMDQSLATLVKQNKVTYDTALEKCNNVAEFNRLAGRA
ncbi:PilT/PilU family type 4a pilus ATPase [Nitriliruptor alkaliphilus]|uniref:PilT/PilU family type 4a pilus ATPase n=1 Tax=Nitriliruptor alkaliphilus TaxID=427918 RepID=UPI0009F87A3E|nr:PilT/PilU family type 4a pilus ATPase [Nitriliruptor alkaliphilus]